MKNNLLIVLSLFLICSLIAKLSGQTDTIKKPEYYKVSEVRIYINDQSDVFELRKQGLGFEHIKLQDDFFDVMLDSVQIEKLNKSGYLYEILIEDVTKDYLERTRDSREKIKTKKPCKLLGFGYGSMGGFYTFSEVVAQLDTMRLLYPNLITVKDSIGASIEGRTIWALKISDNPDVNESEPQVFYNSLTHANEPQGMMTVIYFMYYLLENYGTNPEVTYLVDNRELYFVPVVNPDGYAYNELISPNGGGMWLKNRRDNGGGIFGVNLNRNYGYMWGYDNIGSSPYPQDPDYRGTGPFSEPETQAIRNLCIDKNFLVASNYHTYWDVIFPPWGYNLTPTLDSSLFNSLIMLATAINGYLNGLYLPPAQNYPSNGDVCDWMYGETNEKNLIFGVLPEVGGADDGGYWPPPENIIPLAEENLYANFVYAWGPGVIENPPYINNGSLNLSFCRPLIDTLKVSAIEYNPDNYTSNVYAEFLNSNDSLINEIQLNKVDSTFSGEFYFGTTDENFYKIRFRQSAIEIPSNIYSYGKNKLRFTTAGPVKLDSVYVFEGTNNFQVKPFLKNHSTITTITNASVRLICNDPWVTSITPAIRNLPSIPPGSIVSPSTGFTVGVDTSIYPGYFNFKVEVISDGWAYWLDSMRVPPIAIININPTALAFGGVQIDSSETKTFTITNFGDEDLVVSNIASSEPVFVVNITNVVIPPDSSQQIEVTFTPTALQTYSGVIEIIHNAEGSPDTIIVTGDGVTDVEDELQPLVYSLEQNYPNPFNPATVIKYSIPEVGKVILKLYNLLGEEVTTLVNEEKPAGTYELTWSAANLPSGVYFYQLRAGSFIETKKMLLLK